MHVLQQTRYFEFGEMKFDDFRGSDHNKTTTLVAVAPSRWFRMVHISRPPRPATLTQDHDARTKKEHHVITRHPQTHTPIVFCEIE